jgi:hypothetical protein
MGIDTINDDRDAAENTGSKAKGSQQINVDDIERLESSSCKKKHDAEPGEPLAK